MDRILALLKKLEWSGTTQGQGSGPMSSGGDGPMIRCCPNCRGICPTDPNKNHFVKGAHGHSDNCDLRKEIENNGG